MEKTEKENLQRHRLSIVKDLEPTDILINLLQDGIITDNDFEIISHGTSRRERCQALLSMLPRRGPKAYGVFAKALTDASYAHLVDILQYDNKVNSKESQFKRNSNKLNGQCQCEDIVIEIHGDEAFGHFIRKHCCLLVNNIEPKEIVDHFFALKLFSDDDCERVNAGKTRRDRCACFLKLLSTVTFKEAISVLCTSLEHKYSFIAQEIRKDCGLCETEKHGTENGLFSTHSNKSSRITEQSDSASKLFESPVKFESTAIVKTRKSKQCQVLSNSENAKEMCELQHTCCNLQDVKGDTNFSFTVNPGSIAPFELPSKKLVMTFNHMSSLINQGIYEKFDSLATKLQLKYKTDADMCCLISYLKASRYLFGNKFADAKREINSALDIVPKTTNPKYFTVELFTAKTRMYITQKKLNKLEDALNDVKQIIETDPVGCTGRAAGWLYMNDARGKTAQMSLLNLSKQNSISVYNKMHSEARDSFQKALANFSKDGGKDGPFGCGYALCRLAILLLRCGDNGLTMENMSPCIDDIEMAGTYIRNLEESTIPMPKILEMHYKLAKCDYFYRRNNTVRALEHANVAYSLSTELNLMEFTEHAHNRLLFLNTKTPLIMEEIASEEDIMNALLADSHDSQ